MNQQQWKNLEAVVAQTNTDLPVGLIVDSPWMPGYCGIGNIDFFARPEVWMNAYKKIKADFPEVTFLPDWWNEFGMATEPSGFGCKFDFYDDNLPTVHHIIEDTDDEVIDTLTAPDPRKNGLMPLLLNLQRYAQPRMQEMGEDFYIVSTRGPLTIASHLMELTELLVGIKIDGDAIHKILKVTTQLCKSWLEAQLDNVKTAKGILVLDDVSGFLNDEDYQEFAHPYIKEIFNAFPETMHLFHNDTDNDIIVPYVEDLGADIFNFTHKKDIGAVKQKLGKKVVLLGNVPPMSLVRESEETVYAQTQEVIGKYIAANGGDHHGLLVSTGGGMPMGATYEKTRALIKAAREYPIG